MQHHISGRICRAKLNRLQSVSHAAATIMLFALVATPSHAQNSKLRNQHINLEEQHMGNVAYLKQQCRKLVVDITHYNARVVDAKLKAPMNDFKFEVQTRAQEERDPFNRLIRDCLDTVNRFILDHKTDYKNRGAYGSAIGDKCQHIRNNAQLTEQNRHKLHAACLQEEASKMAGAESDQWASQSLQFREFAKRHFGNDHK